MEMLCADWRFAARSLRKAPLFAALATLMLALGIGPTTAIFSVVYGVLFRPFPFRSLQSLVIVSAEQTFAGRVRGANYSSFGLDEWEQRSRAFESIGMWGGTSYRFRTPSGTRSVGAAYVSERFFSTLDAPFAAGQLLLAAEANVPIAVISHRLWLREYGTDLSVIGRTIVLNDRPYSIVGVTVADFRFPSETVDVWTPLRYAQTLNDEQSRDRQGTAGESTSRHLWAAMIDARNQILLGDPATRMAARRLQPTFRPGK